MLHSLSPWMLAALTLAACSDPPSETRTACQQFQERSCPVGCEPRNSCTDLWLAAAELDTDDVVETCVGACPRTTCPSDTFFDCACYADCTREGSGPLQQAILDAVRCDLEGVPPECVEM